MVFVIIYAFNFKCLSLSFVFLGLNNFETTIGVYAADIESFFVYEDIFNPIINEYHIKFDKIGCHPPSYWGNPLRLPVIDPDENHVVSTRIRTARSVVGYPFCPILTKAQFEQLETNLSVACKTMKEELNGKYKTLTHLDWEERLKLENDHHIYQEGDKDKSAAKVYRYWPQYRGIYYKRSVTL